MAAITNLDKYVEKVFAGDNGTPDTKFFHKTRRIAGVAQAGSTAGRLLDYFLFDGSPGRGVAPGTTPRNPDNTTAGGLLQADPGGGREKWIIGGSSELSVGTAGFSTNSGGSILIYDRLADVSGLDGNSTATQTIGGGGLTLTRYTDGIGVQAWFEIYAQIGAVTTNLNLNFTDTNNNALQTPDLGIGGASGREVGQFFPVMATAETYGVKSVQSVIMDSPATGTTGNFGITLIRPLLWIPCASGGVTIGHVRSLLFGIPRRVLTDACLCLAVLTPSTVANDLRGSLSMIEA